MFQIRCWILVSITLGQTHTFLRIFLCRQSSILAPTTPNGAKPEGLLQWDRKGVDHELPMTGLRMVTFSGKCAIAWSAHPGQEADGTDASPEASEEMQ